jgi:hypothetical protein
MWADIVSVLSVYALTVFQKLFTTLYITIIKRFLASLKLLNNFENAY